MLVVFPSVFSFNISTLCWFPPLITHPLKDQSRDWSYPIKPPSLLCKGEQGIVSNLPMKVFLYVVLTFLLFVLLEVSCQNCVSGFIPDLLSVLRYWNVCWCLLMVCKWFANVLSTSIACLWYSSNWVQLTPWFPPFLDLCTSFTGLFLFFKQKSLVSLIENLILHGNQCRLLLWIGSYVDLLSAILLLPVVLQLRKCSCYVQQVLCNYMFLSDSSYWHSTEKVGAILKHCMLLLGIFSSD